MPWWAKDLALLLTWLLLQLWCGFSPWPENLHTLWVWPKKMAMKGALHTLESIIKKTSVGKDVEKREPLETDGGNIIWHYRK